LGVTRGALVAECRRAGVRRVEHFMTWVRSLSFELLVRGGARPRIASMVVGIGDAANFKRQLSRAEYLKASANVQ
jgi:hypothetical protein